MTPPSRTDHLGPRERAERGLAARVTLPPGEQGDLVIRGDRPDPVSVLEEQALTRVPELVPVRHGRMMVSPFTYFRGSAKGMAIDLGGAPTSGLEVQLCGDAHLSNFGAFASPERRLVFDLNDFDETAPGPWEWDVKRLAASIVVAGRGNGFSTVETRESVLATLRSYRDAMAGFATMRTLDVWYARSEIKAVKKLVRKELSKKRRRDLDKAVTKARGSDSLKVFTKLTEVVDGHVRIKGDPPLLSRLEDLIPDQARESLETQIRELLGGYRGTLATERRALFDRFEFVDMARKVVGVGSVGTRCWIVLLRGRDEGDPLFLQVKEAEASVLTGQVPSGMRHPDAPGNQGERVVAGQRLMQASSDIFLGWQHVVGFDGRERDFYVRQLRDMKASFVVERMNPHEMRIYGRLCGWVLARAHARSGDPIALAAYLGDDDVFPKAVARHAELYADQTERDHAALLEAIRVGRLTSA